MNLKQGILKKISIFIFVLSLLSCAIPVVDPEDKPECKVYTKALTLKLMGYEGVQPIHCHDSACGAALLGIAVVGVTSYIISGSIVLINNSIHWIEQEGTCEDGIVRKYTTAFIDKATELGGYQIEPTKPLIESIEENYSDVDTIVTVEF